MYTKEVAESKIHLEIPTFFTPNTIIHLKLSIMCRKYSIILNCSNIDYNTGDAMKGFH